VAISLRGTSRYNTETICGDADLYSCFPQSLQAKARMVPQIGTKKHPSISFPIYYSLMAVPFDAIQYESGH
jgi:hypothetical protein